MRIEKEVADRYISLYDQEKSHYDIVKFVPASGAASRMFKDLFRFLKDHQLTDEIQYFFTNLSRFAFYELLKGVAKDKGLDIHKLAGLESKLKIVELLLSGQGLNYGNLPKALLLFHSYQGHHHRETVTPLEEHIAEGIYYAENGMRVQLHFTVSPEHIAAFERLIESKKRAFETKNNVEIEIELSTQDVATDQLVVDLEGKPLLNEQAEFIFNPGGHGALIENVNRLKQDFVFIKNIDNVRKQKFITVRNKKLLGGILISIQKKIKSILEGLNEEQMACEEAFDFIADVLQCPVPERIMDLDRESQCSFITQFLDRPIRVVGMVKNEGEPGGGPFRIEQDGRESLQIIEASQINQDNPVQKEILEKSTHFNPVDLVCYLRDFRGEKFDLLAYREPQMGFISSKNKFGQDVLIQELPGLWNGAMGNWITVFVEVPLATFSPVKTVFDLLREEHQ
jgi:hypothetical protein